MSITLKLDKKDFLQRDNGTQSQFELLIDALEMNQ